MRTRLFAMGAVVLISAALSACGGGGGNPGPPPIQSSSTPVQTATPTPTPTPTSTPTYGPNACTNQLPFARRSDVTHPVSAGDCYSYTGSLTNVYSVSAPSPQPTSSTSASVAAQASPIPTTMPNGGGAGTDVHTVEDDQYPTLTQRTISDDLVQNSGANFLLYKTILADATNDSVTTTYNSPQTLDSSAATWSNSPASIVGESISDGTSISRTVASDGSYTETENYAAGAGSATISVDGAANGHALDGAGVYTVPAASFAYAAPSGGNITLTVTPAGGSPFTRTFPAWFTIPSGGYISDTFANNGQQTVNANCGATAVADGASNHQVVETHTVLDPVLGYKETRTTTSWIASGFGAVCVQIADVLDSYYDYQNDNPKIDYQSQNGQPVSVDTFNEFLGVAAGGPYTSVRRESATQQGTAVTPFEVAQHTAAIDLRREIQRAAKARALYHFIQTQYGKGAAR